MNMKCPNCGAETKGKFCEYCGSEMPKEKSETTINITNNYYGDAANNTANKSASSRTIPQQPQKPVKKRKTWLWVLGWLCIFPLPLTILLLRKKAMNPVAKYIIIGFAWILYFAIAFSGGTSDTSTTLEESSAVEVNDVASEKTDEAATTVTETNQEDSLEAFLLKVTGSITPDDVKSYAKELGLTQSDKNSGTGSVTYRVANDKAIADSYSPAKGTVVTLKFDKLKDNKLTEVVYFNAEKMIQGEFDGSNYTLTDYNNPEKEYMHMQMSSFADITAYEPQSYTGNNLLEELFLTVSESTTKEEIMDYVNANGLHYNSRGMGNEEYITYDAKVMEKYGDMGSYLEVDFSDGVLTKMEYCDYPVQYKTGNVAEFYSNYPYSDLKGFYIVNGEATIQCTDAAEAVKAIQDLR